MSTITFERPYYKAKLTELSYIDEIIGNLVRLQRLYDSDLLKNSKEFDIVKNALPYWVNKQEEVNGELNDLKGYGAYKQKI